LPISESLLIDFDDLDQLFFNFEGVEQCYLGPQRTMGRLMKAHQKPLFIKNKPNEVEIEHSPMNIKF
jgi:hypothetical protein